jgi:hypothetical protein
MPAPQGDRTTALLTWAEGRSGCGLSVLQDLLDKIVTTSPFANPILLPSIQTESSIVSGNVSPCLASLIDALYREEISEAISERLLRSENARTTAVKSAEAAWSLLYDNSQSVVETLGKDYCGLQLFDSLKSSAALQLALKSAAKNAEYGYVHSSNISSCESARLEFVTSLRKIC